MIMSWNGTAAVCAKVWVPRANAALLAALLFACLARAESERQFEPPVALEGYCPVILAEENRWEAGDWRHAAVYEGQRYYFAGATERQKFLGNPQRYRVIASGVDVVLAMDRGRVARGKREHGLWFGDEVYLFVDEESLEQFIKSPQRYAIFAHRLQNPEPQDPARQSVWKLQDGQ
jgi:YHS domain-containing protein